MIRSLGVALCLSLMSGLLPAAAEATEEARFDVLFRGITVARGTIGANTSNTGYALALTARSTGLADLFARVRLDMVTQGAMTWPRLRPSRHEGDVDTGRRDGSVVLTWNGLTPTVVTISPEPDAFAVPATDASGTVDPLSALWRITRSVSEDDLCNAIMQVYDGARRSEFGVGAPRIEGQTAECDGFYRRVSGYAPEDMAERSMFPFTAIYRANGELWDLAEVRATSLYGEIRVVRQD